MVASLVHRREAPAAALAAAGIVGTLAEDGGPCTQIRVGFATNGGLKPEILRASPAGDEAAMGPGPALAYRFARASLDRDMERTDPLRDQIVARWATRPWSPSPWP